MKKQKKTRGITTSPAFSFLNIQTDDLRKQEHHDILSDILQIFRNAGMQHYNISHIDDPERDPDIPIKIGPHLFDLSFPISNTKFLLLELKILKIEKADTTGGENGNSKT